MAQLELRDAKERERALTAEEYEVKRGVVDEFKKWAVLEEIFLRQKTRELWLKEEDKSTRFFHKMANTRRRRNILDKLRVNGVLLVGEDNIKDGVANAFFQMILSEVGKWRPSIDGLVFNSLLFAGSTALEFYFSEEEVFAALSSLCGDKALGSDGFTLAFWQGCWEVVKSEVMGFFGEFYEPGSFERSLNATFLVLVPKKGKRVGGAEHLKNFRPISLVRGLYKLLAKVLTNRLKRMVGTLVSDFQHAFVEGRQILNVVLIANEPLILDLKTI